jgi:hypothetical protein
VREQVTEHEADVPFVVYDEHSARASIDDGIGHDPPRLAAEVTMINPRDRRSRCGDSHDGASDPAPGVANATAHASDRIDSGQKRDAARETASGRANFTLWTAVDSWMALGRHGSSQGISTRRREEKVPQAIGLEGDWCPPHMMGT